MRMRLLAAAALALAAVPGTGSAAPARCAGDAAERCGAITVPLDRAGVVPGALSLRYRVRPARTGPRRGVLLVLAGGPGEAAVARGDVRELVGGLAPRYDVATLDTRGTGRGALRCPALADGRADDPGITLARVTALVARCAEELGPRRAFFTATDTAADIEALRRELGVDRLAVAGVSYGTLQAQAYARAFPASVERLVLDSVVDDAGLDGSGVERLVAGRRVLRELCAAGRCRGVTRDPVADAGRLDRLLSRRTLRGPRTSTSGRPARGSAGGPERPGALLGALVAGDVAPALRRFFPGAVRAALDGDPAPLIRLVGAQERAGDTAPARFSVALFAATSCRDTQFPWDAMTALDARQGLLDARAAAVPAARSAPWSAATVRAGETYAICRRWPEAPAPLPVTPLPDVPALILAGRLDVRTSVEEARRVAARLPRATLVTVPGAGHSVLLNQRCARMALAAFMGGRSAGRACAGLRAGGAVEPVPPRRLADVTPVAGPPPRVGRVLRAVTGTLEGLAGELPAFGRRVGPEVRLAGLRGGLLRYLAARREVRLEGFSDVPGVLLDGTLAFDSDRGELRVRGAVPGRLVVADQALEGEIGGVPVRRRLR